MKKGIKKGFTLVELLIVIAVLGTLAVVVLLALNPVQQLARTRDAGRVSGVTQLGRALEAYTTVNDGDYPDPTGNDCFGLTGVTWDECLTETGDINSIPSAVNYSLDVTECTTNVVNNWCYDVSASSGDVDAIVYTPLEANINLTKCTTAGDQAYVVYSNNAGRSGTWCGASEPTAATFDPADYVE